MVRYIRPILLILFILTGCWSREKDNPFEPGGDLQITFEATGYDGYVNLSWSNPPLTDYTGFKIFRSETGVNGTFELLSDDLPPAARAYDDSRVINQKKYFYYLTVSGTDTDSRPSGIATAAPGPGFHWVVDNWDYLLVRLGYDCTKRTRVYYTNYSPYSMIIGPGQEGLVLYTHLGLIESFDMNTTLPAEQSTQIAHPYQACYDDINQHGWIIDSSGVLYRVDFSPLQVTEMPTELKHPSRISVNTGSGLLSVVDRGLRAVLTINSSGEVISRIDNVGGVPFSEPVEYVDDVASRRIWLADRKAEGDFIYTRSYEEDEFKEIDSFIRVTDIEAVPATNRVWILDYQGINSAIVQLSASGIRQITLSSIAYPLDIEVNRYDGSLLVAVSGSGEVLHYSTDNTLIGGNSNFNLPVAIRTE